MGERYPFWLTKRMLVGARGFGIDAYVMALEGWRRGLTLSWYLDPSKYTNIKQVGHNPLGKSFSLYSEDHGRIHYFYRSRGDKVCNEAVDIVHDKYLAKKYFYENNVATPKGIHFHKQDEIKDILRKVKELTFPLVLKPTSSSLGKGVVTDIKDIKELKNVIENVRLNDRNDEFIIEEHIDGEEYRIYVVDEEVVAATKRLPANVLGDGVKTVSKLINDKNRLRRENPYLATKLIEVNDSINRYLEKQDMSLESIPPKNEIVYLKGQSNISAGGDPIDVTDDLDDVIKSEAIRAVKSVDGLNHAGVDVIANEKDVQVIEINATADISMHLFPLHGLARNVPEKIIDYYFPETVGHAKGKSKIYFSYRDIINMLQDRHAQEVKLMNAPKSELFSTRLIIYGKVQGVGYRQWVRRWAINNGVHGYVRNLKNGRIVIVAASDKKEKLSDLKKICFSGPSRARVENVKELSWNRQIKLGFEIRRSEQ